MSYTFSFSGKESKLTSTFYPPLELKNNYQCGLILFSTFNSMPNIDDHNNLFYYGNTNIVIPRGTYELEDLSDYLEKHIKNCSLNISCNNNTLKCTIFCTEKVDFSKPNTIGKLLGFDGKILQPNKSHESLYPVNILPSPTIKIECDIVNGSFSNGKPKHIIYEFAPNVPPGYKIIEKPNEILYFNLTHNSIETITVKILDSKDQLANFRGEDIVVLLHAKPI